MSDSMLNRVLPVLLVAAVAGVSSFLLGQDAKEKAKGRLPAYYASIVTPTQRDEIYALQARYAQEIDALQEQLAALTKKRDAEIESVLTDEQLQQVRQARSNASKKRKQASVDNKSQ